MPTDKSVYTVAGVIGVELNNPTESALLKFPLEDLDFRLS